MSTTSERLYRVQIENQDKPNWLCRKSNGCFEIYPVECRLIDILESADAQAVPLDELGPHQVLAPIDYQEVWACGVTYFSSKMARNEESKGLSDIYEKVYSADRIQVFPKSSPHRVRGTQEPMSLKSDSQWMVPEPELTLVLDSKGTIRGWTIGNDLSCRDIEGENPLYQPQAKIWDGSCALGPGIVLVSDTETLRQLPVQLLIRNAKTNEVIFSGETSTSSLVKTPDAMAHTLFQDRSFPEGAFLLTGTGLVPPTDYCLQTDHVVEISIGREMEPLISPTIGAYHDK